MTNCPTCGSEMKPLFVGSFCPNDCDKNGTCDKNLSDHFSLLPTKKSMDWSDGMGALRILRKIRPEFRKDFELEAMGRGVGWFAFRTGFMWHAKTQMKREDVLRADLVMVIRTSGETYIMKDRYGNFDFDSLPDYP